MMQPRQRTRGYVGLLQIDVEIVEHLPDVNQCHFGRAVRSESEVDGHRGVVGDDVAGHSPLDPHCG